MQSQVHNSILALWVPLAMGASQENLFSPGQNAIIVFKNWQSVCLSTLMMLELKISSIPASLWIRFQRPSVQYNSCTRNSNYPVRVCTVGLCVGHISVYMLFLYPCMYMYVCMYVCMYVNKNRLFTALPFKILLLSVFYYFLTEFKCFQCSLLHLASCIYRQSNSWFSK